MKLDCEIIKDLLPLYADNVCSGKSKAAVEEHLKECAACGEELKAMKDPKLLKLEKGTVIIGRYRRILMNKIVFFLICVLVFPLVNAAYAFQTGTAIHETVLFTIISMLTFVYIPAVMQKKRSVWLALSSVLAPVILMIDLGLLDAILDYPRNVEEFGSSDALLILMMILVPCCLYAVLSLIMFLAARKKAPADPLMYRNAALKAVITETFCLYYCSYISTLMSMASEGISDIVTALANTAFPVFCLWLAFFVFRFLKKNIFIRLGAYSIIFGIFIVNWKPIQQCSADHFSGIYWHYSPWLSLTVTSLIVAAVFIIIGIVWEKGKTKKLN